MAQPTVSQVHVNVPLSYLSNVYAQEESAFVAGRVFPTVPVQNKSDVYWTFDRSDFNRNQMRKRAPGTESAGGGFKIDATGTYNCDVWSLHKDLDDQTRANADPGLNLDSSSVRWLTTQYLISREVNWAAAYFTTGVWTALRTGVSAAPGANQVLQWNDSSSTPIQDVRDAKRTVQITSGGFRPNKLVLGRQVFDTLCDHPDFIDRIKYGQTPGAPAKVTLDAMAGLFEVEEVLVMDGIQNTGAESNLALNSGESNALIGGKAALLIYTPATYGLQTPSCGYTFVWNGLFGATGMGSRIKSFYMPWIESTRIEIDAAYALKVVSADLGCFFTTVIA